MRGTIAVLMMWLGASFPGGGGPGAAPQARQVVDRIVARIEDDILTLSEVQELGRFQQLVGGRAERDDRLLDKLIEQWIVSNEAAAARFPHPPETDVARELDRLEKQLGGGEAFQQRLREFGLSMASVRRLFERQLYFARYLDYKLRPAAEVDSAAIEKYYREELVPRLVAQNQAAPPLETVQDQIRELLIQRAISARAARWLEEARSRLRIETEVPSVTTAPR